MNAVSNSDSNFTEENAIGSDTDTIPDDSQDYYEPISYGSSDEEDSSNQNSDNDHEANSTHLPNGDVRCLANGINDLDLSNEEEGEDKEEEDQRMREAVQRAFREDENRRLAPLTPENTTRVMEAMRGISFAGLVPDWADRIPEDQWMNRLARIRQPSSSSTSS